MKFWKKSTSDKGGINRSHSNNDPHVNDDDYILSKKQPALSTTSVLPTRHERMLLLNSIIHHADLVQSQFAPKLDTTSESTNKILSLSLSDSSEKAIKSMNEKTYHRWQKVLQEGLVPMSVRGLGLLDSIPTTADCSAANAEEEEYFASLKDMEEEIQMMAILSRAASLHSRAETDESNEKSENVEVDSGEDGMEQINSMMKCTAMLMFHIVMMASTPSSSAQPDKTTTKSTNDANQNASSAAGYDARVRHVLKMSCVDVLTRAILQSIESYEAKQNSSGASSDEIEDTGSKLYDVDDYTLWNVPNIKTFVDEHTIGKEAIFGTLWDKKTDVFGFGKKQGSKLDLDQQEGEGEKCDKVEEKTEEEEETEEETERETIELEGVEEPEEFPSINKMHSDLLLTDETDDEEATPNKQETENMEPNDKPNDVPETTSVDESSQQSGQSSREDNRHFEPGPTKDEHSSQDTNEVNETEENNVTEKNDQEEKHQQQQAQAKRHLNAKFLASRKFELIERIVAIDVVRFLMAEERERKLREKEKQEQSNSGRFRNVVEMLKKATEDGDDDGASVDEGGDGEVDKDGSEGQSGTGTAAETNSNEYWTSHRKKQMLRSLKIAGVGLTLGTVFAVTGGLAAPALAASIGGLASLTGAGTAGSTAVLAVLATFKAGAALFGVGGGGLAAYKMKKRTDGLSDFSIRRENIEQFMYPGASDAKMKKGIEAMLPHLHTTVAVSGWLRENDVDDFQLAWGVCPNGRDEKSKDDNYRIRQLKRFYSVYNPQLVKYCEDFMWYLQKKQKKEFSWEKIWSQLETKYGVNPDHMLPIDKPYGGEIFLSVEERDMIDGVLNNAKVVVGKQRGHLSVDIDFNENDEVREFLERVSPTKKDAQHDFDDELGTSLVENLEERMMNQDISASIGNSIHNDDSNDEIEIVEESSVVNNKTPFNNAPLEPEGSPSSASTMQTEHSSSPRSADSPVERSPQSTDSQAQANDNQGNENNNTDGKDSEDIDGSDEDDEDKTEERCPVVWDWNRLYGSDLHTVTWESKMLSSLCHIVENMAMEVSSQATKAALQYSVIGAIISAVALPSALLTASKLIDDPYQIVVIRADEAGKELARCLLLSDERRPVTLVGFSFGARVIYSCLRELAKQQEIWENEQSQAPVDISLSQSSTKSNDKSKFQYDREPASLIADVIFIGLPRVIDRAVLTSCRRVTGGRFINCYAKNDWLLALMFVARGGTPCGVKPILDVPGVENFDVTSLVETHTSYADAIPNILKLVRFCEP